MNNHRPGDTTSLLAQLREMQESLSRVVAGVRENSAPHRHRSPRATTT